MPETYISDKQIAVRWDCSRTTVWRRHRNDPEFPRFVRLSPGVSRVRLSELEAYEQAKAEQSA